MSTTKTTLALTAILSATFIAYQITNDTIEIQPASTTADNNILVVEQPKSKKVDKYLNRKTVLGITSKRHINALFTTLPTYQSGESFFIKPLKDKKVIVRNAFEAKNLILREGTDYFNLSKETGLKPYKVKIDNLGNRFYKYHLTSNHIPIYGNDIVVQVNTHNELVFMGGDGFDMPFSELPSQPSLTSNEALAAVLTYLKRPEQNEIQGNAELEYFHNEDNTVSLAWKMTLASNSRHPLGTVHIDAHSGEMLYFVSKVQSRHSKV